MNSVSFGKISPEARETAQLQMLGMRTAAGIYKDEKAYEKLRAEEIALVRAENDPDYFFDLNPKHTIDKKRSKRGKLYFVDECPFLMYKTKGNNDKYAYIGRIDLLQDGTRLADKINNIIEINNLSKGHMRAADHCIASHIYRSDDPRKLQDVLKEARKILNVKA